MTKLQSVNQIVAVGSVDGVLTTAALLRYIGSGKEVDVVFCQAFTVDKIDVNSWKPGRTVAFVDLAVNNRDEQMTVDFVASVKNAGHSIVAVIDEHDWEAWELVLGEENFKELEVIPHSQSDGVVKSSGKILDMYLTMIGQNTDPYIQELCVAADAADRMDFSSHFASIANMAVKSAIADDSRRVHLVRHLAFNPNPDEKISGWIAEYKTILATHNEILESAEDLGGGILRIVATGRRIDMTTLLGSMYKDGARVAVLEAEAFDPLSKSKKVMVAFATGEHDLDLLSAIKADNITASGFASKANVDPADEEKAMQAVRNLLG